MATTMTTHKIVSREEWLAARAALLEREKEHTRTGDELARQRRELPWVTVEKHYTLQTADGPKTLAELFDGRSQLLIYHFMFGPSYEAGCPTCSSMVDGVDGLLPHLHARDLTMLLLRFPELKTKEGLVAERLRAADASDADRRPAVPALDLAGQAYVAARYDLDDHKDCKQRIVKR